MDLNKERAIPPMMEWPFTLIHTPTMDVLKAVANNPWQEFRESLKGLSTPDKLAALFGYSLMCIKRDGGVMAYVEQLRVDNYIKALLRGGQLVHKGGKIVVNR